MARVCGRGGCSWDSCGLCCCGWFGVVIFDAAMVRASGEGLEFSWRASVVCASGEGLEFSWRASVVVVDVIGIHVVYVVVVGLEL